MNSLLNTPSIDHMCYNSEPHLRDNNPKNGSRLIYEAYTATVRDKSASTSDDDDLTGRRLAFARLVALGLSRYKSSPTLDGRRPTQQDFVEEIGISRATLDRWLKCRWVQDPEPANVDRFIEVAAVNGADVYAALGWGQPPQRFATPPARNPRLDELHRLLEDPHVPESYKAYVQTTLDLLLRNSPISD